MNIVSIQVGVPREMPRPDAEDRGERIWRSAIFKDPVPGPVWVHADRLEGDDQAAKPAHGGPDRAVLGYSASHYDAFRQEIPGFDFSYGAFGENLTIAGLTEDTVYLGDTVQIGGALFEVSVPRTPCDAISRRCGIPDLLERVRSTIRIGWFYRVLEEGYVDRGDSIRLLRRPYPEWSVAHMFTCVARLKQGDAAVIPAVREMIACPPLAAAWRGILAEHCDKLEQQTG